MAKPSKWIQINKTFQMPPYVKEALEKLDRAGFTAFVVGGSVRDFLLGRPTKDHDIATSADPDTLAELFPHAVMVGKAFGVIKIPVEGYPYPLEIASFRKESGYTDFRHPKKVEFADIFEDARRRDFTINAFYYDSKTRRILDQVDGFRDLESGTIRAIGDPMERFQEDALRLIRAVRFSALLGFEIESSTREAIRTRAKLIGKISAERIRDELTAVLMGPRPAQGLMDLSELGLLDYILPEVAKLKRHPMAFAKLNKMLEIMARHYSVREVEFSWAVLGYELGRIGKGSKQDRSEIAQSLCLRLKMSRAETARILELIEEAPKFRECFKMRDATLQRFVRLPRFDLHLALHRVEALATDGNLAFYVFCSNLAEDLKKQAENNIKILNGEDLIQFGMRPGPRFSEILRTIEDLALEGKLKTKEQALEYVLKHFVH